MYQVLRAQSSWLTNLNKNPFNLILANFSTLSRDPVKSSAPSASVEGGGPLVLNKFLNARQSEVAHISTYVA